MKDLTLLKIKKQKGGYSLVEVLVAITVLLLSLIGPFTIAHNGLKNATNAKYQTAAFFLAQEAIEAVVSLREDAILNWYGSGAGATDVWSGISALSCSVNDPCGVDLEGGISIFNCSDSTCDLYLMSSGDARYRHNSSGDKTPFNRQVVLTTDSGKAKIEVTVTWGDRSDQTLNMDTFIYNLYGN